MRDKCESCTIVKEHLYWTHFNTMHFCQFLTRDFHTSLMIPKKFADSKGRELHDKLEIRGPSGAKWEVALLTIDENLYFGDGWEEFVNDHTLEQNDILIFNYKGNSQFDVLILDKRNLCEKEASYFVTRCRHKNTDIEDGCHAKHLLKEKSLYEIIQNETDKDLESTLKKKPRKNRALVGETANSAPHPLLDDHENSNKIPAQETVLALERVKRRLGDEKSVLKKGNNSSSAVTCASNIRSITEAEKRAVLRKACDDLSDDSFVVVMRATHVYKKFFMTVPAEWLTRNVIQSNQEMILRTTERSWKASLVFYSSGYGHGGFSKGWKEFALGNNLEEFDVCVFKLASTKHDGSLTILDVTTHRVVPEAIPLSSSSVKRISKITSK
ncbi:hypothetical protein V2J09_011747 [Rumex salicifolius]